MPRLVSAFTALGYLAFALVHLLKAWFYEHEGGFEDWPTDRLRVLALAYGIGALVAIAGVATARARQPWLSFCVAMAASYVAAMAVDVSARPRGDDLGILTVMWAFVAVALATTAFASFASRRGAPVRAEGPRG